MTNRKTNWGYLPDYSHQNHTLKFTRRSRNSDTYHDLRGQNIPPMAWVGAAAFISAMGALMFFGHVAGF